jgi:murein hydrolase activator
MLTKALHIWQTKTLRAPIIAGLALVFGSMAALGVAQVTQKPLSPADKQSLEALGEQIRDNQKQTDTARASAHQIAGQIEGLRSQIINMSRSQSVSEQRAAIYRARLETITVMEADLTEKLGALRARESRLLSALQIYSRNPPPAIFISSRRANDAVMAAILMKAITPALRERAAGLAEQNKTLIRLRREAQLNSGALYISESEIAEQRSKIEQLIRQRSQLEDRLLTQANALDVQRQQLRMQAAKLSGDRGFLTALGLAESNKKGLKLQVPVIGTRLSEFKRADNNEPFGKGMSFSTAPGASVIAPGSGQVEYAGALGSYGQVIILHVSDDYRVVMTGMGRVYVDPGASVSAGEPLGRMQADGKPVLYLELRKGDHPVNPRTAFTL